MAWKQLVVLGCLIWILDVTEGNDAHVTCAFSGQCTLPCSIDPHSGNEAVIHWYHDNNNESPVHSYYLGENHLGFQDPKYKGRTFLSLSEIPFGQASLLIKDVRISDEGKYKCYTSTTRNKETFVNVKVYAPVKSVNITLDPDTLTCDTKGVYPDPTLVWSTEPPSDVQQVGPPVEEKNGQDLYSVTSTVHKISNTTYICTVTAGDSTQSVSFRQQNLQVKKDENLIIPCSVSQTNLKDFTLIWLFNEDSVLTFDSRTSQIKVFEQWKDHVKYKERQTTIELQNLNDDILYGTYKCEVLTEEFRYMEQTSVSANFSIQKKSQIGLLVGLVIGALLIIIIIIIGVTFYIRRKSSPTDRPPAVQEEQTTEMLQPNGNVA